MNEMAERATRLGADAVVGIDIDYEVLGQNNGMLMVTVSGTGAAGYLRQRGVSFHRIFQNGSNAVSLFSVLLGKHYLWVNKQDLVWIS